VTHEQLEAEVAKLAARRLISRDILGWLLANIASGEADPAGFVKTFADAFTERIAARPALSASDLAASEAMQSEVDGVVGIALKTFRAQAGEEGG
jgi:hypothetical protein